MKKKVKFDTEEDEVHVYEKKDFVKCTRKSQTDPKMHGKVGKTTEEIRKDDQWAYSCRHALSRGKAMAIIMDERGDVIVGPTLDIMIKMELDDNDEPVREVFVENYVQHVEGRYGKRGTSCVSQCRLRRETRDSLWILVADMISCLLGRSTEWIFQLMMTQP